MLNYLEISGCVFLGLVGIKLTWPVLCWLKKSLTCIDYVQRNLREGDYACITGGTDGIGLEYARQLAAKGYNLLLLSRTQSKLDRVKQELEEEYKVEVRDCQNVSNFDSTCS